MTAENSIKMQKANKSNRAIQNTEHNGKIDFPEVTIGKVYGGRSATVVIVHDDGSQSTVKFLADEFAKNDICGTVALVTNRVTDTSNGEPKPEDLKFWQDILNTGRFDFSSHSRTHSYWGTTDDIENGTYLKGNVEMPFSIPAGKLTAEIKTSRQDLQKAFPSIANRLHVFVKPGGWTSINNEKFSPKALELLHSTYIGMRDTGGNITPIPLPDRYRVNSHMVLPDENAELWKSYVDEAIEKNAMIVFLFHGIVDGEATGISVSKEPAAELFSYIGERQHNGDIWCTYLEDAILYALEYASAKAEAKYYEDRIEVSLTHELDNTIFSHPLTLKVRVPNGWGKVTVTYADKTQTECTAVGGQVHIDLVPNLGNASITES